MGGRVTAAIHCDLVTRNPTVRVDGLTVVDHGQLSIATTEWQENHAQVRLEGSPLATAVQVARSGVQAAVSGDYRLQRVLRPEPGRVSNCPVGDDATAWLANSLYNLLPADFPVEHQPVNPVLLFVKLIIACLIKHKDGDEKTACDSDGKTQDIYYYVGSLTLE